jgi:8-oxo-dGTP pyrophosphatase MutT (NUDIX family)
MIPNKACAVVLRGEGKQTQVLAFQHPIAGFQLVKGTIEPGELAEDAALRELAEEAGISSAVIVRSLGVWQSDWEGQVWALIHCQPTRALPETWEHHAPDDGGHCFRFFWHSLWGAAPEVQWHVLFRGALRFIQNAA